MSKATEKQPALEAVTLLQKHVHRGESKQPGETIEVNAADKKWLEKHNIIAASAADTK